MTKTPANVAAATLALRRILSEDPRASVPKIGIASDPQIGIIAAPREVWGCVVPLALDQDGCRVLQSALDQADSACRTAMANEMKGNVCKAVDSPHANHVLQRFIEVLAPGSVRFILQELSQGQHPTALARHRFGCRVLERLIEHFPAAWLSDFLQAVLEDAASLCGNQFGTFVMQHILEHGLPAHKRRIADALLLDVQWAALDQNAVGVVDSALSYAPVEDQKRLATAILKRNGLVQAMSKSGRGHTAVVRLLRVLETSESSGSDLAEARRQLEAAPAGARGRRGPTLLGAVSGGSPDKAGNGKDDMGAGEAVPRPATFVESSSRVPVEWTVPPPPRRRHKGRNRGALALPPGENRHYGSYKAT